MLSGGPGQWRGPCPPPPGAQWQLGETPFSLNISNLHTYHWIGIFCLGEVKCNGNFWIWRFSEDGITCTTSYECVWMLRLPLFIDKVGIRNKHRDVFFGLNFDFWWGHEFEDVVIALWRFFWYKNLLQCNTNVKSNCVIWLFLYNFKLDWLVASTLHLRVEGLSLDFSINQFKLVVNDGYGI